VFSFLLYHLKQNLYWPCLLLPYSAFSSFLLELTTNLGEGISIPCSNNCSFTSLLIALAPAHCMTGVVSARIRSTYLDTSRIVTPLINGVSTKISYLYGNVSKISSTIFSVSTI